LKAVRYPPAARPGKLEGKAVVQFQVRSNGHVSSRRILNSSGHAILDQAALEAVDRIGPLPPFSPALKKEATNLNFTLPLVFRVSLLGKIFGL
jgi:protein TonB